MAHTTTLHLFKLNTAIRVHINYFIFIGRRRTRLGARESSRGCCRWSASGRGTCHQRGAGPRRRTAPPAVAVAAASGAVGPRPEARPAGAGGSATRGDGRQPRGDGGAAAAANNLKFTGLAQNLGQLEGSYMDFQSNCWVNLRIWGQPCEFYFNRGGALGTQSSCGQDQDARFLVRLYGAQGRKKEMKQMQKQKGMCQGQGHPSGSDRGVGEADEGGVSGRGRGVHAGSRGLKARLVSAAT